MVSPWTVFEKVYSPTLQTKFGTTVQSMIGYGASGKVFFQGMKYSVPTVNLMFLMLAVQLESFISIPKRN